MNKGASSNFPAAVQITVAVQIVLQQTLTYLLLRGSSLAKLFSESAFNFAQQRTRQNLPEMKWTRSAKRVAICAGAGVLAVAAVPVVLTGVGFTAGGVVAGTAAAKMMSVLGTSGVLVPTLQSIGAAGLGIAGKVLVGGTAAKFTDLIWSRTSSSRQPEDSDETQKEDDPEDNSSDSAQEK